MFAEIPSCTKGEKWSEISTNRTEPLSSPNKSNDVCRPGNGGSPARAGAEHTIQPGRISATRACIRCALKALLARNLKPPLAGTASGRVTGNRRPIAAVTVAGTHVSRRRQATRLAEVGQGLPSSCPEIACDAGPTPAEGSGPDLATARGTGDQTTGSGLFHCPARLKRLTLTVFALPHEGA